MNLGDGEVSHRDIRESVMLMHARLDHEIANVADRFAHLETKIDALATAMKPLESISRDVSTIRDVVEAMQGLRTLGRFAKWMAGVGAAIVVAWGFTKALAVAIGRSIQ